MAGLTAAPASLVLFLVTLFVGLHLWNVRREYTSFGVSYHKVIAQRQVHRVLAAPLAHASLWHLLLNGVLLWTAAAFIEASLGSVWLLQNLVLGAICAPALLYAIQASVGTRELWWSHVVHRQVYAGMTGALISVVVVFALLPASPGEPAPAAHLPSQANTTSVAVDKVALSADERDLPVIALLLLPFLSALLGQVCVPDVTPIGHVGGMLAGLALSTLQDWPGLHLGYWAASSTAALLLLSLPSLVAAGSLPPSCLCRAHPETWAGPDAAAIAGILARGADREAAGEDEARAVVGRPPVTEGEGRPTRLPLLLARPAAAPGQDAGALPTTIVGRAPPEDSDEEVVEEEEGEQGGAASPSLTWGTTWHVPRPEGGSIQVFRVPASTSTASWGLSPPPRPVAQRPTGEGAAAPRRHWPDASGQGDVEEAPLLSSQRHGATGTDHCATGAGGVAGLAATAGEVHLGDLEAGDGEPLPLEEQGSRGGTGTPRVRGVQGPPP